MGQTCSVFKSGVGGGAQYKDLASRADAFLAQFQAQMGSEFGSSATTTAAEPAPVAKLPARPAKLPARPARTQATPEVAPAPVPEPVPTADTENDDPFAALEASMLEEAQPAFLTAESEADVDPFAELEAMFNA